MSLNRTKELNQYFTPVWVAEILFERHFSHLSSSDLLWEPSCGKGAILSSIPRHIPCIASEIDPHIAEHARIHTKRDVITGDFLNISLPDGISAVFTNPPWTLKLFIQLLDRCKSILKIDQKAGFILPAYFFQTSNTVMDYSDKWKISHEILPRDIFTGQGVLSKPIVFASFVRDHKRHLIGFNLFEEVAQMSGLNKEISDTLRNAILPSRGIWRKAIEEVLVAQGGSADLQTIYKCFSSKRPSDNSFWKEKIRQTLSRSFIKTGNATYSLPKNC